MGERTKLRGRYGVLPRRMAWMAMPWLALALACPLLAEESWSLRPLVRPVPPAEGHPVDAFIHARLAKAGLRQNDAADPHTLLRRMTLDLTGLPPTREEIQSEIRNPKSEIQDLADRLLASPHYGERWGRHWLDVARYVQGTIKVPSVAAIDLAEPYRDYVVRSFNEDKPYDRFLAEQLAGDLLAPSDAETEQARQDRLVAPAFLSIGPWFEECTDPNKLRLDLVDEQISTATRAFLAMDFSCARCHDHKFDPISIRDYYALAGIFRSTEITSHFAEEWKDGRPRAIRPLAPAEKVAKAAAVDREIAALREERLQFLKSAQKNLPGSPPSEIPGTVLAFEAEAFDGHKDLKTVPLGDGEALATRRRLDQWVRYRLVLPEPGAYTLLVRYAATEAAPVELEIEGKVAEGRVLGGATHGETPDHFRWDAVALGDRPAGRCFVRLKVGRNEPFPTLDRILLVKGALSPDDRAWRGRLGPPTPEEARFFLSDPGREVLTKLESRLAELERSRPALPPTLAVRDADAPTDLAVRPGGDVYRTEGDPVPRGNPALAGSELAAAFPIPAEASGRLQFARWLADPRNPLTARVMANRIWHWHFGTGLVRTVDDFGKQGAKPTHPELLDWLACELIGSGWSVKHLHRLILTSATYRASSATTPDNLAKDPDGTLHSRFPARRLEVEAIYDGMLASIGKVPRQPAGAPLDTSKSKDRALYILTSSRSPLGLGIEIRKMFPLFGFDDSGRPMHDRDESVTAAQALWWLNNPLPRHYATKLAEKLIADFPDQPSERALALHETVLGRPPGSGAEAAMLGYAEDLARDEGLSETEAWTRVALGLFSSNSFRRIE